MATNNTKSVEEEAAFALKWEGYEEAIGLLEDGLHGMSVSDTGSEELPRLLRLLERARTLYDLLDGADSVEEQVRREDYEEIVTRLQASELLQENKRLQHAYIKAAVDALFPSLEQGLWGYDRVDGKRAIEPRFTEASPFRRGRAVVKENGSEYVMGREGNDVAGPIRVHDGPLRDGSVIIEEGEGVDLLLPDGRRLFGEPVEWIDRNVREGLRRVMWKGRIGLVDEEGNWQVPPDFEAVGCFSEGLAWFMEEGKVGFIDEQGRERIPASFRDAFCFQEGVAAVRMEENGCWGFVGPDGELLLSPIFERVGAFRGGSCPFQKKGLWGSIDRQFRVRVPWKYRGCTALRGGFLELVTDDGVWRANASGVLLERSK